MGRNQCRTSGFLLSTGASEMQEAAYAKDSEPTPRRRHRGAAGAGPKRSTNLGNPALPRARVASAVENRQHANFLCTGHIVDAVVSEPAHRSATHIGKTDAIQQRVARECANRAVYFVQEISAQSPWRSSYQIAAARASCSARGSRLRTKLMKLLTHALEHAIPRLEQFRMGQCLVAATNNFRFLPFRQLIVHAAQQFGAMFFDQSAKSCLSSGFRSRIAFSNCSKLTQHRLLNAANPANKI